jgi:transcription antitermination factor NusG
MMLQISGVVTYLTFCGKPAIVQDKEIENIRTIVKAYSDIETVWLADVNAGDSAIIMKSPLLDQYDEIIQVNGKSVIMVIDSMNCTLRVKTDRTQLALANKLNQKHFIIL